MYQNISVMVVMLHEQKIYVLLSDLNTYFGFTGIIIWRLQKLTAKRKYNCFDIKWFSIWNPEYWFILDNIP